MVVLGTRHGQEKSAVLLLVGKHFAKSMDTILTYLVELVGLPFFLESNSQILRVDQAKVQPNQSHRRSKYGKRSQQGRRPFWAAQRAMRLHLESFSHP
jgi:hypothetical protein